MKIKKSNVTLRTCLLAIQLVIIVLTIGLMVVVITKRKCKVLYNNTSIYFNNFDFNNKLYLPIIFYRDIYFTPKL